MRLDQYLTDFPLFKMAVWRVQNKAPEHNEAYIYV